MFWFLTTLYAGSSIYLAALARAHFTRRPVEVAAVTICVVVATIDTQGALRPPFSHFTEA